MENEWNKLLEENQSLYIYGAGKIGKKIFRLIKAGGRQDKVKGFLVSDKSGNPDQIEDIPVLPIDRLRDKDALILLSVTDIYQEEILDLLRKRGFKNTVCAYKYSFLDADNNSIGTPDTIVIDTRELLIQQYSNGSFNRIDVIVRLLAVEDYYRLNDIGFSLYKKMQDARVKEGYSEKAFERFKALIKSFAQKGYDDSSEIIVDPNLKLTDGSHRLALALFHQIPAVKIRIDKDIRDIYYGIGWFRKYFTQEECKLIEARLQAVSGEWIRPIKGIIWPNAMQYRDEITDFIDKRYPVTAYKDFKFPKEIFEKFVRGVYQVDDVAEWKINSKLEHFMESDVFQVRVIDMNIGYPDFRIKDTGRTISCAGEALKRDVREAFKDKIDRYYYDIIFHTADNYYQSWYLDALLPKMFSLRPFFESIEEWNWMLVKTDNEYFPKDFPDEYVLYKDIDIITTQEAVGAIKEMALAFLGGHREGCYQIRQVNRKNGYLIRLELENFLIFQIDISFAHKYLSGEFITRSLENKVRRDGYYAADAKDECLYRFTDFIDHQEKGWHLDYVLSYFDKK